MLKNSLIKKGEFFMNEFLGTKEDVLKELNINPKIGLTEETKKLSLEKILLF